jgi:hypothetical protein
LANSSPGLPQPWGFNVNHFSLAFLSQPFQGCENQLPAIVTQGFKANPGLELANAFSVHKLSCIDNDRGLTPTALHSEPPTL